MPAEYSPAGLTKTARARAGGGFESALTQIINDGIAAYYKPAVQQFISWDAPRLAHTGIDIDYKLTAYDWEDRELIWSVVDGPTGMTIEADGTLHWTPDTDLVSESIVVECSLGGEQTLSFAWDLPVDNARSFFVAPAPEGSDSNTGTLASPFLTFERAAIAVKGASTARTIYTRAGTYDVSWFWDANANFSDVYEKTWAEDEPLLLRNYPGEEVKYQTTNGHGFRMSGAYSVAYGMWFAGATLSEVAGCRLAEKTVAKRMRVSDSDWFYNNNCTGFKHMAGSLLDQCQGWDNYDRDAPTHHNNSNFLGFCSGGAEVGPSYVIDCLSDGLAGRTGGAGFKIKHAGLNPVHYHKVAAPGNTEPFTGICNKMTVRHSVFFGDSRSVAGFGRTDKTTPGEPLSTDNGFLVQHNVIYGTGSAASFSLAPSYDAPIGGDPILFLDNDIVNFDNSSQGNLFIYGEFTSSSGVHPDWQVGFSRNRLYSPSPSDAVNVKGVISGPATLTDMGADNEILAEAPNYAFSAAGRDFQIVNGVCSEVIA